MPSNKNKKIFKKLNKVIEELKNIALMLEASEEDESGEIPEEKSAEYKNIGEEQVIEGVFNGESMVSNEGQLYPVPPNYASKSKLVEGDILKLTITPSGDFIYKQIAPTEREKVIADLIKEDGQFYAVKENKRWQVLNASITYFKGEPGDQVVIHVPKGSPSTWAAVDTVIKK